MRKLDPNEHKKIILEILVKIDSICRENGLTYMLIGGTLLGAVRHQGFIPWDDDIDIIMPYKDYVKLADMLYSNSCGLNFISIKHHPDTIYSYGKVCDTHTELVEHNFKKVAGYGAFVDVFPLTYYPNNTYIRELFRWRDKWLHRCTEHSARTGYVRTSSKKTNLLRWAAKHTLGHLNTRYLVKKIDSDICKRSLRPTNWCGISGENAYPTAYMEKQCDLLFEGHLFRAPVEYDSILKIAYGDYMTLPPIEEQKTVHHLDSYIKD